jgi:hypothetical protein
MNSHTQFLVLFLRGVLDTQVEVIHVGAASPALGRGRKRIKLVIAAREVGLVALLTQV